VLNNKHIPPTYLRASEAQRRQLLAGLLDTDGTVVQNSGSVQPRPHPSGWLETLRTRRVSGRCAVRERASRAVQRCPRLPLSLPRPPRKSSGSPEGPPSRLRRRKDSAIKRYITAVTTLPSVPVRCVQVERRALVFAVEE
jgi:replicative DNA helicase